MRPSPIRVPGPKNRVALGCHSRLARRFLILRPATDPPGRTQRVLRRKSRRTRARRLSQAAEGGNLRIARTTDSSTSYIRRWLAHKPNRLDQPSSSRPLTFVKSERSSSAMPARSSVSPASARNWRPRHRHTWMATRARAGVEFQQSSTTTSGRRLFRACHLRSLNTPDRLGLFVERMAMG